MICGPDRDLLGNLTFPAHLSMLIYWIRCAHDMSSERGCSRVTSFAGLSGFPNRCSLGVSWRYKRIFDCIAGAVLEHGGVILNYICDSVFAIIAIS